MRRLFAMLRLCLALLILTFAELEGVIVPSSPSLVVSQCLPHLPPGVGPVASCERLPFGNTNAVHRLETEDGSRFLVRVFGGSTALAFDRQNENMVFEELSSAGHAPSLVAALPWGRIEGWVEGRACSALDCRQGVVNEQVADKLAALHSFDYSKGALTSPAASVGDESSCLEASWGWRSTQTWLTSAESSLKQVARGDLPIDRGWTTAANGGDSDHSQEEEEEEVRLRARAERLHSSLGDVRACLDIFKRRLEEGVEGKGAERATTPSRALELCYCHNDLSPSNVHFDEATEVVQLIDFEFGGLNFRGFDLATHFSHWAGGAVDGRHAEPPLSFPSPSEQRPFLDVYAKKRSSGVSKGGKASSDENTDVLLHEAALMRPLVHACWGAWAACSLATAFASPPTAFSHFEYAERHFKSLRTCFE